MCFKLREFEKVLKNVLKVENARFKAKNVCFSVSQLISLSFAQILRLRKHWVVSIHFQILEQAMFYISRNYETRKYPPFAGPYVTRVPLDAGARGVINSWFG